ncbi:MAG: DMT family transporter [Anaerolineae bacterium]
MRIFKLAAVLTLWALSFILNDVALRSLEPATVVAGRWSVTAILTLLLLAQRRQVDDFGAALRRDGRAFFLLSLFGVTLLYGLQISGQARTSTVNTGLLANTVPIFTALLAMIFLHQRLRPVGWAGIVLAMIGAWVVSTGGLRLDVNPATALGDGLVLLSSLAAALYFVYGAQLLQRYPALLVTAAAATLGALTLLPVALLAGRGSVWTWQAVAAVIALGVGPGLLANLWWWETVEWLDASRAAIYIYLIPLLTMIFAVLLLGETVGPAQLGGAALLLGGVWLAERSRRQD